jgi:hypothetical protein
MEEPADSVQGPFEISYVTSDLDGDSIEAVCLVKKPGEAETSYGTETFSDGNGTGICEVTDAVLSQEGTYTFRVKVTAGEDPAVYSNSENVSIDNEGPDRPKYVEKDKKSSCKYEITVKTADDDQTTKVEVYRDDDTTVEANNDSRVKTLTMGPDEKESFVDELYGSECGKTYYYAARAFDSAGNPSEVRAEEVDVTKTVEIDGGTITEDGEGTLGAIPTRGGLGTVLGEDGTEDSEEGDENEDSEEGEVLGEGENGEINGGSGNLAQNLFNKWWFWLIVLAVGGYIAKMVRDKNAKPVVKRKK